MNVVQKIDLSKIKNIYNSGGNVMEALRKEFKTSVNTSEIIEISYDMQSGSYIKELNDKTSVYFKECASVLSKYFGNAKSVVDAGAGELTTTAGIIQELNFTGKLLVFDISWSRLLVGKRYFEEVTKRKLDYFVADLKRIPLLDKSIDVLYTNHALEPNHGSEDLLLKELNRVTRQKIVLFEPYYEAASETIKERMNNHGYVRNLEDSIKKAGCVLEDIIKLEHSMNLLNPTYAFVIRPSGSNGENLHEDNPFACPYSLTELTRRDSCFYSVKSLMAYPIIEGIPLLRVQNGIVASHMI